ncbi:hypothetical protein LQZ24_03820 [Fructobacillus sp. M1-13]|uniref:DoxX family protein n=1 Tax=Fructobacillus papyriferae TaxID=2713171 RepID=A0ABS5QPR7_9LACO|nr:hypothetical protein [Fructobacillus papyriferae]MBS9335178.1 hypothetical protein [Fructobacillus papyriferae]MCD2159153.1 hypothetical protein [Fructobacillus papyriferae]
MEVWQSGYYLNRLIRAENVGTLITKTYLKILTQIMTPIFILDLGEQLIMGGFLYLQIISLISIYSLLLGMFLIVDFRFGSTVAILMVSLYLLVAVFSPFEWRVLGAFVFRETDEMWSLAAILIITVIELCWLKEIIKRKDFFGEEYD